MGEGEQQRRRLLGLIEMEPPVEGDGAGSPSVLRRLCSAVTRELPAPWAGLSLMVDSRGGSTVTGSDAHARQLEGLQFDLGEGPCIDAVRARRPVSETDLMGSGFARWPAYAPAAYQLGARSVFAYPLQVGAVCVGALDVYGEHPAVLAADAVVSALGFATIALDILLEAQARAREGLLEPAIQQWLTPRLEVYQAQGMVMVDLGVTMTEAMARLRAHAYSNGRPLEDVAADVVAGRLKLQP